MPPLLDDLLQVCGAQAPTATRWVLLVDASSDPEAALKLSGPRGGPVLVVEKRAVFTSPAEVLSAIREHLSPPAPSLSLAKAWVETARVLDRGAVPARVHDAALLERVDVRDRQADLPISDLVPQPVPDPVATVVIPCFNDGLRLLEALASTRLCASDLLDVVVADDGSTDSVTVGLLDDVARCGVTVLRLPHQGAAAARNAALEHATTEYVIPLDADNLLRPGFVTEAVGLLRAAPRLAVVHSDAERFGEVRGTWLVEPYELRRLLRGNYIDTCAVLRRDAVLAVGRYAQGVNGVEDWDLWLSLAEQQWGFAKLDRIGFDYRVRGRSNGSSLSDPATRRKAFLEVARRHADLYAPFWPDLYNDSLDAIDSLMQEVAALQGGSEAGQ